MQTATSAPLRRSDYLLLVGYCLLVQGFTLVANPTLTTHETVGCVNVQEMMRDGDWLIPHYGGRPWLERPPLPFWFTMPFVHAVGDVPLAYRLAALTAAVPCILLVGWMAALWYGRGIGLLAGLILATIREFAHYAAAPESDIFLCTVVTAALALFVKLEFQLRGTSPPLTPEPEGFLGRRPWAVLAFFVVLGLANLVKGLIFGDLFILLPIAAFLLLGTQRWAHLRRYVWLPGWLAFLAVAAAWATAAYLRHPGVLELWKSDYVGRYNKGYMREPFWYYFAHLPWILFPWTVAAGVGLAVTWPRVFRQGRTPERFLWCWALVPLAFFSIPQGKHHHYLLQALAPWAVLSAVGVVRLWQWLPTLAWLRSPWPTFMTVVVPGEVGVYLLATRAGAPAWLLPVGLIGWPVMALTAWWSCTRKELLPAMVACFALLAPLHWLQSLAPRLFEDRYVEDLAFLERVRDTVPADAPLLIANDFGPLGASWHLYYLHGRGRMLHNLTFLREDRGEGREVYVLVRRFMAPLLQEYGTSQLLFETRSSREENMGTYMRDGLYLVRLHDNLIRYPGPVYVSPMQATGRSSGPELNAAGGWVAR